MCFRNLWILLASIMMLPACVPYLKVRQMRSGQVRMQLSVSDDSVQMEEDAVPVVDTIRNEVSDGPIIMNAIRDSETGEMVATDVIRASKVTAGFRHVAERNGYVTVAFDITVPADMMESRWRLKVQPSMRIQDDTLQLLPVYVTGDAYRQAQLRGYQRYRAFLASIITDTTDLVKMRQLEVFLERHFPETYSMKNDSSIVSRPMEENLFGVTQMEALRHYTRHWRVRRNQWKKKNTQTMFERLVKDPIEHEGVRLDTVLTSEAKLVYQYNHTFKNRPGLKKVNIGLTGRMYEDGRCFLELPFPEELTFYISTLSSLADTTTRYVSVVLERSVFDYTKALIDFESGSSAVDTLKGDNASEFRRIIRCMHDVASHHELELDSLVVSASCSPEGTFRLNSKLSQARSRSVLKLLESHLPSDIAARMRASSLPENWRQLSLLVKNDTLLENDMKIRMLNIIDGDAAPDDKENLLAGMDEYKYLREKIYPQLRSVSFEFYLHRKGMVKDTVHTTQIDTAYMSGLSALMAMDYKKAVEKLRPYADYNAALAYLSSGYEHSAIAVLQSQDLADPKVCYLLAMALSRLQRYDEAIDFFESALVALPALEFRANLDPEMSELIRIRNRRYR